MPPALSDLLILVVTFSMALTPLLFLAVERLPLFAKGDASGRPYDVAMPEENQVIIAGFGRYGQIVARILQARKIGFTALEANAEQVDFVRRYGNKVYYGDASRLDLLRAAKADTAVVFILAIDDVEASVRTAETVAKNFPNLRILARARNREHAYRLMEAGVTDIWRETFHSSLATARSLLTVLGLSDSEADRTVETFREHDEHNLAATFEQRYDDTRLVTLAREWAKELEEIFEQDARDKPLGDD